MDVLSTFITKPIYRGDTAALPIQCKRSDGTTPISLTGASLKATLKQGDIAIASWQVGSGITVTDAINGLATLLLLTANTDQAAGLYDLDIVCTEQDGTRTTAAGTVRIVPHPTR